MKGVLASRRGRSTRTAAAAAPVITLRSGGRASRTPKAVQALAASGAAPMEIAHRTGLPFDAVAMLLELAPAR
jgi:2-keto-3-deoxy-6-phosphogluconate aldolase